MPDPRAVHKGRGAVTNPTNRFERFSYEPDPDYVADDISPSTQFFKDPSRSILTTNDSPDVAFEVSVNPYRGCEHGCVYCFARPTHEYLGLSAGLDFETKIMVKEDAPRLLREELASRKWVPKVVAMSGVTDPYQPIERRLRITRGCLEVLLECRNPVIIITKNHLVTRDVDLFAELARFQAVTVFISITTLDASLARKMEPRTASPELRLDAVETLARAGVPTGVLVAPVVPAITDHEMPAILAEAANRGAQFAGFTMLRLPWAVASIFEAWVDEHFPDRREKILNRVRELRGGKLNDPRWQSRMRGEGVFAQQMEALFEVSKRKAGMVERNLELSTDHFRRPAGPQGSLF